MNPETNQNQSDERRSASWDIKNAAGNYLSLVVTQFGSAFFAFAAVWLISKQIGSEGYGGVVAIIAASQVAQILVNWTSYSVIKFGTEEFVETARIARIFWLRLFVLLPNALLVILTSGLWYPPLAKWLKLPDGAFWLVIAHFTASALWIHVQFSLQGAKLPRVQGLLLMAERIVIVCGLILLVLRAELTPLVALVCYTVAPVLMAVAGVVRLRQYVFAKFEADVSFLREVIRYSLPLMPFALVGYFSGSYVDAIFVSQFLSTKDLGIYSVATQINGIALQLPTVANSLIIPFFVTLQKENRSDRLDSYFADVLPTLVLGWGILCIVLNIAGYLLIPTVFGEQYEGALIPLAILTVSSVIAFPVLCGFAGITHSNSVTTVAAYASLASAIANIAFNYLLIPRYGLAGCAWATVAAHLVSTTTFVLLLKRSVGLRVSWMPIAVLPIAVAVAIYSLTGGILFGAACGLAASALVALVLIASLRRGADLLIRIVRRSA